MTPGRDTAALTALLIHVGVSLLKVKELRAIAEFHEALVYGDTPPHPLAPIKPPAPPPASPTAVIPAARHDVAALDPHSRVHRGPPRRRAC